MTWKTFNGPSGPGTSLSISFPVNLARVCYAEKLRSLQSPANFSGNIRLVFGKDSYLDVKDDELARQNLADVLIPVTDKKT